MNGFAVIVCKNTNLEGFLKSFSWKSVFDFQHEHIVRTKDLTNVYAEQKTSKCFLKEKLWIDNSDYFIVTEGVVTNLKILCKTYNAKTYEDLISKICCKENFFKEFTGNFAGYIFLKKENKHILFNNHTATKKVFYFSNENYCIFSTDLFTLSKKMDELKIAKSLNIEASYLLLTSGFMHENMTLINEVKQVRAGEYFCVESDKNIKADFYFHLNDITETQDTKEEIIEKLDEKFKNAINLEFSQNSENNFLGLCTLSGGLDSRTVSLVALENNFKNVKHLCFTQKDYADEFIAKKIAKRYELDFDLYHSSPNGLIDIESAVKVNDGLTLYSNCEHVLDTLKNYRCENIGFVHTGIAGEVPFGYFLTSQKHQKPTIAKQTNFLFPKIKHIVEKSMSNYKTEEIYQTHSRVYQGTGTGFLYFDLIGECSSAFLEPDFMTYTFSIPRTLRYKYNIYIDWLKAKHPDIIKFTWEAIGGKPTNNKLLKQYYRYKRAAIKRLPLINSMWKYSMTPEQLWYDQTPEVKKYLDNYFEKNIYRAEKYPELKTDLINLYKKGDITEKTQVLTLLAALKLLFSE